MMLVGLVLACSSAPALDPMVPQSLAALPFEQGLDEAGWQALCREWMGHEGSAAPRYSFLQQRDHRCHPAGWSRGEPRPVPSTWTPALLKSEAGPVDHPLHPQPVRSLVFVRALELEPTTAAESWLNDFSALAVAPCTEHEARHGCRPDGIRARDGRAWLRYEGLAEGRAVRLEVAFLPDPPDDLAGMVEGPLTLLAVSSMAGEPARRERVHRRLLEEL